MGNVSSNLREMNPLARGLSAAWNKFKDEWSELRSASPIDTEDDLSNPLSPDEIKRQRFRWVAKNFEQLGPRFSKGLDLLTTIMPDNVALEVKAELEELRVTDFRSHTALHKGFKLLGDFYLNWRDKKSENWEWHLYLEFCGGYPPVTEPDLLADIKHMVSDPLPPTNVFGSQEEFVERASGIFEKKLRQMLSNAQPRNLTFQEFIADRELWATSGATSHKKKVPFSRDRRTRWHTSWWLTVKQIVAECKKAVKAVGRGFFKEGEVKIPARTIIMVDDVMYWLMQYIRVVMRPIFEADADFSILWSKIRELITFWVDFRAETSNRGSTKLPVDQKQFDHWQVLELIREIFRILGKHLGRIIPDVNWVVAKILNLYANFWVLAEQGDARAWYQVKKGVQSGLALTADIDTLLNWLTFMVAHSVAQEISKQGIPYSSSHFGDDIRSVFKDYWQAGLVFTVLLAMGVKTNIHKTWVGSVADEFLRQLSKAGKLKGYLNRLMATLLWRKPGPVSTDDIVGIIPELAHNWGQAIQRGAVREKVYEMCLRDISGATGASKSTITSWINTPASFGGGGWFFEKPEKWTRLLVTPKDEEGPIPYPNHRDISVMWGEDLDEGPWWAERVGARRQYKTSFIETKKVSLFAPTVTPSLPPKVSLTPSWKEGVPQTGRGMWATKLAREGRFDEIEEKLEPGSVSFLHRLRDRASRNVLFDWVAGKLSPGGASTPIAGQMIGQPTGSQWVHWYFWRSLNAAKVTRNSLKRAAAAAEVAVYEACQKSDWWQG
jgi:hypothetical protein